MNFGFVINNRTCIGCHACSTACKSENEVPLGTYRTWVKYIETGRYPDVSRRFQVTRCNHCANPPCVKICPVSAMYQRSDGIVEFDGEQCIGCKACLQACPYDAIYIDPEQGTAAKCHYCSHRVETGLEPACVVVCPTHSIIAGDMDDPNSEISRVLGKEATTVRKPEQGTEPKLFYVDGDNVSLNPIATAKPDTMMFADVVDTSLHGSSNEQRSVPGGKYSGNERMAEQMVQTTYNAQHRAPWHWQVPAYLVTKALASGIFIFLCLGILLDLFVVNMATMSLSSLVSLFFLGITTALLIFDLERPERFLRIILQPQWKSWLTKGAFLLMGFGLLSTFWWALETFLYLGILESHWAEVRAWLNILMLPLAIGAAIYTAFLFAQAEGRDLWQSSLLPLHLFVQALCMGSAFFISADSVVSLTAPLRTWATYIFVLTLAVSLAITLLGEVLIPHASQTAAKAAKEMHSGKYALFFWFGGIILGHMVPLLCISLGGSLAANIAVVCAIAGLYFYEHAFVMAPQEIPNS